MRGKKMAKENKPNLEFEELKRDIKCSTLKSLYAFQGEERYLLEHYLKQIRKLVLPEGMEEFNHRTFTGVGFDVNAFNEAVEALPVFAEKTLIEVHDLEFNKIGEEAKKAMAEIFADIPDYACIIFVFDTVELKLDARVNIDKALKKALTIVKFESQNQSSLVKWIRQHFSVRGKQIDTATAEYLAFISGGLMTSILTEIEKCVAYAKGDTITREVIDAVVTPELDAVIYKMTDEVMRGNIDAASAMLGDLLKMQEAPHKISYALSQKMRQLLAAKICVQNGYGLSDYMNLCGIKYDFQARNLMSAARNVSVEWCKSASGLCAETAYKMNRSGQSGGELLSLLLAELALISRR